jgi:hypothetical protein
MTARVFDQGVLWLIILVVLAAGSASAPLALADEDEGEDEENGEEQPEEANGEDDAEETDPEETPTEESDSEETETDEQGEVEDANQTVPGAPIPIVTHGTVQIEEKDAFKVQRLTFISPPDRLRLIVEVFLCDPSCDLGTPVGQYFVEIPVGVNQTAFEFEVNLGGDVFAYGATYAFRYYADTGGDGFSLLTRGGDDNFVVASKDNHLIGRLIALELEKITFWEGLFLATVGSAVFLGLMFVLVKGLVRGPSQDEPPRRRRPAPDHVRLKQISPRGSPLPRDKQAAQYAQKRPPDKVWAQIPDAPRWPVGSRGAPPSQQSLERPEVSPMRDEAHRPTARSSGAPLQEQNEVRQPDHRVVTVSVVGRTSRKPQADAPVQLIREGEVVSEGRTDASGTLTLKFPLPAPGGITVATAYPEDLGYVNSKKFAPDAEQIAQQVALEVAYQRSLRVEEEALIEEGFTKARASMDPLGHYAPPVLALLLSVFDARRLIQDPPKWAFRIPDGPAGVEAVIVAFSESTKQVAQSLARTMSSKALVNILGRIEIDKIKFQPLPSWELTAFVTEIRRGLGGADAVESRSREIQGLLSKVGKGLDTRLYDSVHRSALDVIETARKTQDPLQRAFLVVYASRLLDALRSLLKSEQLREELRRIGPI